MERSWFSTFFENLLANRVDRCIERRLIDFPKGSDNTGTCLKKFPHRRALAVTA